MTAYKDAVKELYFSLYGTNPTNFHAILYHLIAKADPRNKALLRLSYPMEVHAWEEWRQSPNEDEFFAKFGLGPSLN